MKRPIQHIIEEESRKAFAFLIPDGWVMNDFTKDYGKDINVEIFKNFRSTGKSFICQLKGTTQKFKNGLLSIQMDVSTLEYFATVSTPILLVFYSTETKSFYGIWANSLISCYPIKDKQKTINISMGNSNKLTKDYFDKLPETFDSNIFLKMNVVFDGNSRHKAVIQNKISKWLERYFSGFYEYENFLLPVYTLIKIDDKEGFIEIKMQNEVTNWNLTPASTSKVFSFFQLVLDDGELCDAEYETLYVLTSIFAFYSPKSVMQLLSKCLHKYHGKFKDSKSMVSLATYAVEAGCIIELQRLIKLSIEHGNFNDFQTLNSGFFKVDKNLPELRKMYEDNLKEAIEHLDNSELKGTFCYNLANHYRGQQDYFQAVKYFNIARRFRPIYLEKHYWWHEYAGVIYLLEHYQLAAAFYKKSIEMDAKQEFVPLSYALMADAEFMNMRFIAAEKTLDFYFRKIIEIDKLPDMQYAFLHLLCQEFIRKGYSDKFRNNKLSMELFRQAATERSISRFQESLSHDPLNYNSHFSLGLMLEEAGEDDQAFLSFLAAGLITRGHKQSFLKCLQIQIRKGDIETAFNIAFLMVLVFDFSVLNLISDNIATLNITIDEKNEMLMLIQDWAEKIKTELLPNVFYPKASFMRIFE